MDGLLSGWFGQLAATAGVMLTLAGIFGLGFRIGLRENNRTLEREITQLDALIVASRDEVETYRAEGIRWKNKLDEVGRVEFSDAEQKLETIRRLVSDGRTLWLRAPKHGDLPPSMGQKRRPVITIGNLKGGVGKTTFAVHLAAALARDRKILLVDLDYQGSASTLLLRAAEREDVVIDGDRSRASSLVQRFSDVGFIKRLPIPLGNFAPNLSVIPAHYPLADTEESLMLRWAIGDEPEDIRYNLHNALQSDAFDHAAIIIDAPPRLTTAMAQALAASTHVIIPTQLESKSTEAAVYFAVTVGQFISQGINPNLKLLGVVPNMVEQKTGYKSNEAVQLQYLRESLRPLFPGERCVWDDAPIYDKIAFRRPNLVFSASDKGSQEASRAMNTLALEVARSVGLAAR